MRSLSALVLVAFLYSSVFGCSGNAQSSAPSNRNAQTKTDIQLGEQFNNGTPSKFHQAEPDCHSIGHPVVQGYVCIHPTDRRKNPDILYFFHGVDRPAEDWRDRPEYRALQDLWQKSGRTLPTVLSVTFGKRWFMKTGAPGMGLHEYFVKDVMPALENAVGGLGNGRRMIMGESMGGANSALLFIREQQLFNRAAFVCPAFSTVSPFDRFGIVGYILRNKADGFFTWYFMGVARDLIGRPEQWNPNNPLDMVTHMIGPQTPPVYISSMDADEFGFFEGGNTFVNIARQHQAPVQFVPRQGRHCMNYDLPSIVEFLSRP